MLNVEKEKWVLLTKKEQRYFRMMYPKSGVLFITAEPGVGKSAIMRSIAKKLDFLYIDIRLSQKDETDVGLYPYLKDFDLSDGSDENLKNIIKVLAFAVPEWAIRANSRPTIIHFEELNRAPIAVRNACLELMLERTIGSDFKFNENVYMVSSGNLGDSDGTDVEEFDRALNNRLIHVTHSLDLPEWIEGYASENIHPEIIKFLMNREEHFLHSSDQKRSNDSKAYATPRSWTFISDYIVQNYGMDSSIDEWSDDMRSLAASYVGEATGGAFIRFLDESLRFSIKDVINRYDEISDMLIDLSRDKKSELFSSLKNMDVNNFNDTQKENIKKFVLIVSKDEATSFMLKLLDEDYRLMKTNDDSNSLIEEFLLDDRFEPFYDAILEHVPNQKDKV